MRAALRPLAVGLAVIGLAAAGAASAQACDGHHSSKPKSSSSSTSWEANWSDNDKTINKSIFFGPMQTGDKETNIGNKVLSKG